MSTPRITSQPQLPKYALLNDATENAFNEYLPRDFHERSKSASSASRRIASAQHRRRTSANTAWVTQRTPLEKAVLDARLYHFLEDKQETLVKRPHRQNQRLKKSGGDLKKDGEEQAKNKLPFVDVERLCALTASAFEDPRYSSVAPPSNFTHSSFLEAVAKCVDFDPKPKLKLNPSSSDVQPRYQQTTAAFRFRSVAKASANREQPPLQTAQAALNDVKEEDGVMPVDSIDRVLDYWRSISIEEQHEPPRPTDFDWNEGQLVSLKADTKKSGSNKNKSTSNRLFPSSKNAGVKINKSEDFDARVIQELLSIAPHERTNAHCKQLFAQLRNVKAFHSLSDFMLTQICWVAHLSEYEEADRVVFKQGDLGTCWYVIIKGEVKVNISKGSDRISGQVTVATLKSGEGFGDLALINDRPRAATILTSTPVLLTRIEKADYNRILKFVHYIEGKEKNYMLRRIKTFAAWDDSRISTLAGIMRWRTAEPGHVLMEEGKTITEVIFIRQGSCCATKTIQVNGKRHVVRLGSLGKFDYFGEEAILLEPDTDGVHTYRLSSYTVVAETKMQVASFTMYDAQIKFKEELALSPMTQLAVRPTRVLRTFHENAVKEYWTKYRDSIAHELYPESTKKKKEAVLGTDKPRWH